MPLAKLGELPKPIAVNAYFDLIQIWRREPLDEDVRYWLDSQCRHLYCESGPARHDHRLRQRLEMKNLSQDGLRWLVTQEDAFLNRAEFALDLHFSTQEDCDEAWELIHYHLIRLHRRGTQKIELLRGEGRKCCREDQIGLAETRYDGPRRARNRIVKYRQDHCRITGEVLPLLHLEWRTNGVRSLRSPKGLDAWPATVSKARKVAQAPSKTAGMAACF
jgi:hypothetical protein